MRKSRRKRQGILRLICRYGRVRLRYGLNKFKVHALKILIQYTASVGNLRTIASCKEKHSYKVKLQIFRSWSAFSRKMSVKRKTLLRVIVRMMCLRRSTAFLRWKLFSKLEVITNGLNIHKANIVVNRSKLFNLRRRRAHFKQWKLFTKTSINNSNTLLNLLDRRDLHTLRIKFTAWNIQAKKSHKLRKCLRRMLNVVCKQGYLLALTKWRAEVHRINIEDALCLGHSAMRKTKYDMARRIFSRLRRSRMNQAFKQWKLDTRDERENEERTHAIEAMSNWAARVSGGRVLKERFGLWFAFVKQSILQKDHQYSLLRNSILRMRKYRLYCGFRKWFVWMSRTTYNERNMAWQKERNDLRGKNKEKRRLSKLPTPSCSCKRRLPVSLTIHTVF